MVPTAMGIAAAVVAVIAIVIVAAVAWGQSRREGFASPPMHAIMPTVPEGSRVSRDPKVAAPFPSRAPLLAPGNTLAGEYRMPAYDDETPEMADPTYAERIATVPNPVDDVERVLSSTTSDWVGLDGPQLRVGHGRIAPLTAADERELASYGYGHEFDN